MTSQANTKNMSVNQTVDELKAIRKDENIQRAEYFKQKENKQINIDSILEAVW